MARHRQGNASARKRAARAAWAACALLTCTIDATAAECRVPGSHPTIQAALDSVGCNPIRLESQGYFESPLVARSVVIGGNGTGATTLWGQLRATGSGVVVIVQGLTVYSGCPGPALLAEAGASMQGANVVAARSTAAQCNAVVVLFADGFE
jgi:hypothetical protein